MTTSSAQPTIEQLREDVALLREELTQLAAQLARVDTRTEGHGQALDDIEAYVTETVQLAQAAAHQAASTAAVSAQATAQQGGLDMHVLVPWVEDNITTLIARKVPTTDGAPKWCPQWWDHAEAIARLEAARQAWLALSAAGGTGLVTYFDYLDRVVLAVLTSETGPFARCGPRQHTIDRPLGHIPPPPEAYEAYDEPDPPATNATPTTHSCLSSASNP